jgi:hypothetical protein
MADGLGMGRYSSGKVTEGVNWRHESLSETAEDGNWHGPSSSGMSSSSDDWRLVSGNDDVICLWQLSLLALALALWNHFRYASYSVCR